MKYTGNLNLKKPEGTDIVNIDDLNENADILDGAVAGKVDKVAGKGLSDENFTAAEKNKLAGIATGANNYTHPSNHPASIITQDASNRFVTDTEKANWNAKETPDGAQTKVDTHTNNTTTAHGATSAATANKIIIRDAAGRAKVVAPSATDDIARKAEVDAVQTNLTSHANLTTTAHGGIVPSSDVVTAAAANKLLKLNASAKLPASITGDADTVDGYHAGIGANNVLKLDANGLVPLGNIPNTLVGKNAEQLNGKVASGTLLTVEKNNLVTAINELFTGVSNGKNLIATAITDKGIAATGSDSFETLSSKIRNISPLSITGGVWVSASSISLIAGRDALGGVGGQSAALSMGGQTASSRVATVEKFNGQVWVSATAMPSQKAYAANAGKPDAALITAGLTTSTFNSGSNYETASTYLFNGSSWAGGVSTSLTSYNGPAGCGITTAALVCGGSSGSGGTSMKQTYLYNGSVWASASNLINERAWHSAVGTQSSALVVGNKYSIGELFNGSTWSSTPISISANYSGAMFGISNNCIYTGGSSTGTNGDPLDLVKRYNGTTAITIAPMVVPLVRHAGCGDTTKGMTFGGKVGLASTQFFNS